MRQIAKQEKKVSTTKLQFFDIYKIDKPLARLVRKKREET